MHKLKWKQTLWSVTVADRLTIIWHETIFRAGKTAVSWLIKRCHHRHVFRPNRFLMIQLIQIKRMQMLEKCLSVHVCSSLLFLFNRFKCHWVRSVMHSINLRLGCCVMFFPDNFANECARWNPDLNCRRLSLWTWIWSFSPPPFPPPHPGLLHDPLNFGLSERKSYNWQLTCKWLASATDVGLKFGFPHKSPLSHEAFFVV